MGTASRIRRVMRSAAKKDSRVPSSKLQKSARPFFPQNVNLKAQVEWYNRLDNGINHAIKVLNERKQDFIEGKVDYRIRGTYEDLSMSDLIFRSTSGGGMFGSGILASSTGYPKTGFALMLSGGLWGTSAVGRQLIEDHRMDRVLDALKSSVFQQHERKPLTAEQINHNKKVLEQVESALLDFKKELRIQQVAVERLYQHRKNRLLASNKVEYQKKKIELQKGLRIAKGKTTIREKIRGSFSKREQ